MTDGYAQQYSSAEVSEATVDLSVEVFAGLVPFGIIIAIGILYKLFTRNK